MPAFVEVARFDHLAIGTGIAVTAERNTVALFNVDGVIYAIDTWCAGCAASVAGGTLEGRVVRCFHCGWQYDVTTGALVGLPALRLDTYKVTVVDGKIMVESA